MDNDFNITSAQYMRAESETENTCIEAVIDGVKYLVPLDPDNIHYAEILKQVKEGSLTIADAD